MEHAHHLVVLVHGVGAWPSFMNYMAQQVDDAGKDIPGGVAVHIAKANESVFQTQDGIVSGGARLADEIEAIASKMPRLEKFSIIGHSVGGLYARYAIGLLHLRGLFGTKRGKVQPVNFITLATPHLGIRRSGGLKEQGWITSIFRKAFHAISGVLGRTGMQLMMHDTDGADAPLSGTPSLGHSNEMHPYSASPSDPEAASSTHPNDVEEEEEDTRTGGHASDEVPILAVLSRPDSIYFKALRMFQHRSLYANIVGDVRVPFSTSAIVATNPFKRQYWTMAPLQPEREHVMALMEPESHEWTFESKASDAAAPTPRHLVQEEPRSPFSHEDPDIGALLRTMFEQLNTLSWRRVAVLFTGPGGYPHPMAHEHLIVTTETVNGAGKDVVADCVDALQW